MTNDEVPDEVRRWVAEQIEGQLDNGEKKRVVVRFTPTEHKGTTERAAAEGCSSQRWIINSIRASLTNQPKFTMDTTKALWESSYQLRSIGRNLNQVTKRFQEAGQLPLMVKGIDRLASFIYEHTDKVTALTDASLGRWLIQKNEGPNPQW